MADRQPRLRLVVGCGYLGERVARRWIAMGDPVMATTRRADRAAHLGALGITPCVIDVADAGQSWNEVFRDSGPPATVLWSVGFDRSAGGTHRDVHVLGLTRLLDALAAMTSPETPTRVIFSSSTGVWGDLQGGVVNEATPTTPSRDAGVVLVEAETRLRHHPAGPGTSLRFAGLYGPGRLPRTADLAAGRPIAADPESWLNLVHIDDAAAAVTTVADAAAPRPLYVVSDGHPVLRRDWYGRMAELTHSPAPQWNPEAPRSRGADKRVDSSLLRHDLGFRPAHPDPLASLEQLVRDSA